MKSAQEIHDKITSTIYNIQQNITHQDLGGPLDGAHHAFWRLLDWIDSE